MMNPFMSYTQSFNESMTKDDREDAERRMAYVKPVTAGIASPAAIQAAQSGAMTKDEREDAERRMSLQATSTPRQIVPSAQLSTAAPEQQYPLPMSVTSKPVNTGIASPAAIQAAQASQSGDAIQETQDAIAAAFKALSVSRSQGTVNVNAFNLARVELKNAKDTLAVAKSRSTPSEQVLMFQLEEQVEAIQGEVNIQLRSMQGAAAKSTMTKDDREDAERRMATAKPVTAGIASPAAIQAAQASQSGDAIQETQDAIALAFKALSVSRSQGTVNVNAFNNARRELLNAKDALAVAKSRSTPSEQVLMFQLEEQVEAIQGEVNMQFRYLKGAAQTPSGGGSTILIPGTGTTGSPVISTATGGGTPAAVAGTDWAKLALQVGTAYLLLS